jgi:hypothetical protein
MIIRPAIRLILISIVFLVQFFFAVTNITSLGSKNAELSSLRVRVNREFLASGDNIEQVNRKLNQELINLSRSENIIRVNLDETTKVRDLAPKTEEEISKPTQKPTQSLIAR